MKNMVVILW